ncbi:MAG: hypothetical protein LHW56_01640 [Candidatus Cloacimonetes bacterium]|nr:hypothetical protein [Candidatus Cloacimonadota bacterium]MDY0171590.1 hypothetical protein [Candidatus Cloacimonadaceae bacterium]
MPTNAYSLSYKVFIAGVEVPCHSVQVMQSFNALPRCTLGLEPDSRLFGLGRQDRVPVQVFVSNHFQGKAEEYLLLFEGEVESSGYTNTATGRNFVINCQSILAFLQDIKVQLMQNLNDEAYKLSPGNTYSYIHGGFIPEHGFPMCLFLRGVGGYTSSDGGSEVFKYPSEFLINALQLVSSTSGQSEIGKFYAEYMRRWRVDLRYAILPYFDDNQASFNGDGFPLLRGTSLAARSQQLSKLIGAVPSNDSLFGLLTYIVSHMEYEFAFFSTPRYSQGRLHSMCLKPLMYDALPPRCNVMFRSMVESLSCGETVYGVPTRIRTADSSSVGALLTQGDNTPLAEQITLQYYPRTLQGERPSAGSSTHPMVSEILENEKYTGPFLFDTIAPPWLTYISPKYTAPKLDSAVPENEGGQQFTQDLEFADRARQSMLLLKRYEPTSAQVALAFNPFITPGFPGVVYDNVDLGVKSFTMVGQVLSLTHTLGKNVASTTVEMGFVRTLEDAYKDGKPTLKNSYAIISEEVTHVPEKIGGLYKSLLGCSAASFEEIEKLGTGNEQEEPRLAYRYNNREIVTLQQYFEFVNDKETGVLSQRRNSGLRSLLEEIAQEVTSNVIYD